MRILFLAPQPFFQERGTPIAVDLVLRALSERGDRVDLLTYHLGQQIHYEGVTIYRTPRLPFIREIAPGFSIKKVVCDILMFFKVFPLVFKRRYQVVHAVEESVFIAMVLKKLFKIPYVYDMDSSLSQQMIEHHPRLFTPVFSLLKFAEGMAIRRARAVVPVCDALYEDIEQYGPRKVLILRDISLLESTGQPVVEDLRAQLGIDGPLMMYVGNLETYQGIDLMLESFSLALQRKSQASLVVIGGKESDIQHYRVKAGQLGIQNRVHFLGPKPVEHLAAYLSQADILVSPRVKGKNTPMKIYSYLHSGKALLATNLPTHTQVLNKQVAVLADPSPYNFSRGVLSLVNDKNLRQQLGTAGKSLVAERHTYTVFRESLDALYDWLRAELEGADDKAAVPLPNYPDRFGEGLSPEGLPLAGLPSEELALKQDRH